MGMHARLKDGSVIELKKDCECGTHTGPHWIHMDNLDRERNRKMLERGGPLAILGCAREETVRLEEKLRQMERRGIVELLPDVPTAIG